jgi:reductive dehalogenase
MHIDPIALELPPVVFCLTVSAKLLDDLNAILSIKHLKDGQMNHLLFWIIAVGAIVHTLIALSYFVSSIWEKEKRASIFGGLQFLIVLAISILLFYFYGIGFFTTIPGLVILILVLIPSVLGAVLLMSSWGVNRKAQQGSRGLMVGDVKRHDEREIMFARNRSLRPDSEQYQQFYQAHPEYEPYDTARREKGGPLGHPGTIDKPHERPNVAATFGSLSIPMYLSTPEKVNPVALPFFPDQTHPVSPEVANRIVKGYARNLGADLVGVTAINPKWIYSHRGEIFHENWDDWGQEIELTHRYAVVFATEMALDLVGTAPHTPTTIASMGNYAQGAYIAAQLAAFIANLGYSATAHHLRHYDFVMVPLAVDAGLGECGRLGYLITKEFGPRVRLGAVSTDLPLVADKPIDIGVEDFCRICNKCAACCPSGSIPQDDPREVNGTLRWKLNAETCFDYWGKVGTDCNICMRVCPWGHANTFPHKIIRSLIARNRYSRRLFSIMDDIFYGKKPKPKDAPKWASYS